MVFNMSVKITILCENSVKLSSNYIGEHGFSCLIETEDNVFLFDTGQGLGVLHNALALKKNLKGVDGIVLSHGHWDHAGGLEQVLNVTGQKKIYAHPDIFLKKYSENNSQIIYRGIKYKEEYLESLGGEFVFNKNFTEIASNIYLSGEIPRTNDYEQNPVSQFIYDSSGIRIPDPMKDDNTLVIDTEKGLLLILGCAHAGVVNILDYIHKRFNKNIYAVIGGTHLKPANNDRFKKTIEAFKSYDIQNIGVSHCTGLEKSAILYNEFGTKFFFASVGTEFLVE